MRAEVGALVACQKILTKMCLLRALCRRISRTGHFMHREVLEQRQTTSALLRARATAVPRLPHKTPGRSSFSPRKWWSYFDNIFRTARLSVTRSRSTSFEHCSFTRNVQRRTLQLRRKVAASTYAHNTKRQPSLDPRPVMVVQMLSNGQRRQFLPTRLLPFVCLTLTHALPRRCRPGFAGAARSRSCPTCCFVLVSLHKDTVSVPETCSAKIVEL